MHGAVAAPQASATRAGLDALREGGNAVDAALAAAVSLTVSYPNNCALGGDLIALVCRAGEPPIEINASGPAGADTDVQAVRAEHASMPVQGPQTVTVPGLIAGLDAVWSAGARRPWASAFETAIAQAEDGIAVVPSLAEALRLDAELLGADEGARGVFFADGRVLRSGEHLRQPALAATLRTLAQEGAAAFYAGELGDAFVRRLRELGAPLHRDDLAAFRPDVGAPLRVALADGRELVTSRPNTQGFLLPLILGAARETGPTLDPLGADAPVLARIAAAAIADRERHLCDPRTADVPLGELLDPARLRALAERARTSAGPAAGEPRGRARGDTVAVVTADAEGNAVCLIQSVFHAFGSGILDPATGIIAHNRGALFTLDPASPNVLAPGKRPAHTLMPSMLLRDGLPEVVLGTMGGSAQPQILAQILLHHARGLSPAQALDAPRWLVGGTGAHESPCRLLMERRVADPARQALLDTGMPVQALGDYDGEAGHAQMIRIEPDGSFLAASDPRSEGAGAVTGPRA